jgi:hypothetical protein
MEQQSTGDVLMIRLLRFAGNVETAVSNRFQHLAAAPDAERIQAQALAEFDGLAAALRRAGVQVHVFGDTPQPHTPDSIFPNNWVSFHADGTVVTYPMMAPSRRLERRMDLLEALSAQHGFRIARRIDLTPHEENEKFLEGTGSLVLDRAHRVAYACVSPRTDLDVLGDFSQQLDYELITFEAFDAEGAPVYHTNVLMCVGSRFATVCLDAIAQHERTGVLEALRSTGHTVIEISLAQMYAFAGNMLELRDGKGQTLIALSASAFEALSAEQRATLSRLGGPLVAAPIPTIERLGGGSVRCMLAEIFLPRK